ncbi:MAG: Zn-dependent hydrolase, partial [Rhodothermales bacterium]
MTPIDRPAALLKRYRQVRLEADLGALDDEQREMIRHLVEAAREMDAIYWIQAYGDRSALLASISDPGLRRYAEINYGPWDRLSGNEPFLEG